MSKITAITMMRVDDRVYYRLYSGKTFVDAEISTEALALHVSDGAKLLLEVLHAQRDKAA